MAPVQIRTRSVARSRMPGITAGTTVCPQVVMVQPGIFHPQGFEQLLLEQSLERFPADTFKNKAEQHVTAIAVDPLAARLRNKIWLAKLLSEFLRLIMLACLRCVAELRIVVVR